MKKFIFGLLAVICVQVILLAAAPVMETPINGYGTPGAISVSSTTLTMVPTSRTSGTVGLFLAVPSTAPFGMAGFLGNCTSNAVTNSFLPIQISTTATTSRYVSMRDDVCLWLLSLDTVNSTRPVYFQEVKQ